MSRQHPPCSGHRNACEPDAAQATACQIVFVVAYKWLQQIPMSWSCCRSNVISCRSSVVPLPIKRGSFHSVKSNHTNLFRVANPACVAMRVRLCLCLCAHGGCWGLSPLQIHDSLGPDLRTARYIFHSTCQTPIIFQSHSDHIAITFRSLL
jgi:hypothetical protein